VLPRETTSGGGPAARLRRHDHSIEVAGGALTIAVGVLVFTDRSTVLAQWLTPYLPTF
jgi:hypothetical protein